jgi:hypothetical protein
MQRRQQNDGVAQVGQARPQVNDDRAGGRRQKLGCG